MVLIVYSHPSRQSHNGKILKNVTDTLKKRHLKYEVIDLYQENFQNLLSPEEYQRMQDRDRSLDEDVKKYQKMISEAKNLIFIYPTWWYNMPAILKGFFDRVFTSGFAFRYKKAGKLLLFLAAVASYIPGFRYLLQPYTAQGLLKEKRAYIFRTYGGPRAGKRIFGNTSAALEQSIFRFCGLTDTTVHELFNINQSSVYTEKHEKAYLDKVLKICQKIT